MMAAAQLAHEHRSSVGALVCPGLLLVAVGPAALWAWFRADAPRRAGAGR